MLDLLGNIWNAVRDIPYLVADLLVGILNAFIAAIAALAALVLGLLPEFPDSPGAPDGGVLGFLNWVAPLGPMLATFGLMLTCWTGFLLIKIALKWVKAL